MADTDTDMQLGLDVIRNYAWVPSPHHFPQLTDLLDQSQIELIHCNAEIERMQSELDDMKRRRKVCHAKIEVYRAACGPIRRLPVEVLAEIFILCCDGDGCRSMPLELCRICRFWTEVALTTSQLWSSLGRIRFQYAKECSGLVNIADTWLQPLEISVSLDLDRDRWQSAPASLYSHQDLNYRVLDLVITHLPRCRRLVLKAPYPLMDIICHIPGGSVDMLEEVYLETFDGQHPSSVQMSAFANAPRLSSLTIQFWREGIFHSCVQFPWAQLTKLVLLRVNAGPSAPHILAPCSSLEECTLEIEGWNDSNQIVPCGTVNLPNLRTLSIRFRGIGLVSQFFRPLVLPHLTWFFILFDEIAPQGHWPHSEIISLLSRSSPPLEILELFWDNVTIEELVQVLRAVPSLLKLRVAIPELITPALFESLSYSGTSDQNVLPRLQALDMTTDLQHFPLDPHETIVPLIQSRWWSNDQQPIPPKVARLMRVGIDERDCGLLREFIAPLYSFRKEGLRVTGEHSYEDEGTPFEWYDIDNQKI